MLKGDIMKDKIVVIYKNSKNNQVMDIEVPNDISADEFVSAMNEGMHLEKTKEYMCSKNPRALIKGSKTLAQLGIRNGTTIFG